MDKLAKPILSWKVVLGGLGVLIALGMLFAGCATKTPMQAEMDLGSCGFKWKSADTPEKLKQLESLPQRKIVRHQKEGKSYYLYADAQECKCVFVGDEKTYQEYRQLVCDKNKVSSANSGRIGARQSGTLQGQGSMPLQAYDSIVRWERVR